MDDPTIYDWKPSDGYIPPAIDEDAERAAFEEWAAPVHQWNAGMFACLEDGYCHNAVEYSWSIWLARAKQGAK